MVDRRVKLFPLVELVVPSTDTVLLELAPPPVPATTNDVVVADLDQFLSTVDADVLLTVTVVPPPGSSRCETSVRPTE